MSLKLYENINFIDASMWHNGGIPDISCASVVLDTIGNLMNC